MKLTKITPQYFKILRLCRDNPKKFNKDVIYAMEKRFDIIFGIIRSKKYIIEYDFYADLDTKQQYYKKHNIYDSQLLIDNTENILIQ